MTNAELACTTAYTLAESDPLSELSERSRRLAQVVESSSRRRDCREFRSRILLLLLESACPLGARPRRGWYTPGAAARLGPDGLRRGWHTRFGEAPRSLRSFRSHLGALEQALAIIRSPGDWMPHLYDPDHPERRPRYAETIHLLQDERAALWWEGEGSRRLAEHPEARHNPTAWRSVFAGWRKIAERGCLDLIQLAERTPERSEARGPELLGAVLDGFVNFSPDIDNTNAPGAHAQPLRSRAKAREAAVLIAVALKEGAPAFGVLRALWAAGAEIKGTPRKKAALDPERLSGAAAMLAIALLRDDGSVRRRVRNRAAWVVRAFEAASNEELREALATVTRKGHR